METKITENLEIFKKIDHNRPINNGNLNRILKSIQSNNLLKYRPILVDESMGVIDGQHRLEAAKILKIPIFYQIAKDDVELKAEDIILLNSAQKSWRAEDYLNFHVKKGNEDYIKLAGFIKQCSVSLKIGLVLCNYVGGKNINAFKNGLFKFPTFEHEMEIVEVYNKIQELKEELKIKLQGTKLFIESIALNRSLLHLISIKSFNIQTFRQKLLYRLDLFRPCARIQDYLNLFTQIYNWKNKNPIHTEFANSLDIQEQ